MLKNKELYAAIDLGSNSFHMIVAQIVNNQLHIIDRHKDMVRLANGLSKSGKLTQDKIEQAIASLEKIGQRIAHIPKSHLRVVGTNTLRKAKNAESFLLLAEKALGKPIDIISGREEARILYLGVAHSLPSNQGKRLVIDIGGGSTELIIGQDFEYFARESLHMGCVSYTKKYFSDGLISSKNWNKAVLYAKRQLLPIVHRYISLGWNVVIGASGTMRSSAKVISENGFSLYGINPQSLNQLVQKCWQLKTIDNLSALKGLSSRRQPVFIGGLAIISALVESLNLNTIQSSTGALREGIIYDLSGRLHHNDIRQRSIDKFVKQFKIDTQQSQRVQTTVNQLIKLSNLKLSSAQIELLSWASQLHELGLNISHSHFEKHAAYIIQNADMPGFSTQEQLKLSVIVALLRRKIKKEWLLKLSKKQLFKCLPLLLIFRAATLLNRPRINQSIALKALNINDKTIEITFAKNWLNNHPLTKEDLLAEAKYLKTLEIEYVFTQI